RLIAFFHQFFYFSKIRRAKFAKIRLNKDSLLAKWVFFLVSHRNVHRICDYIQGILNSSLAVKMKKVYTHHDIDSHFPHCGEGYIFRQPSIEQFSAIHINGSKKAGNTTAGADNESSPSLAKDNGGPRFD